MMEPFQLLEHRWAAWANVENTVACSSGSSALHLALEALQLDPGSEVLVPEFTMVACARAVTMAGLKPVFVDCNDSLLMDPEICSRHITQSTRAIMPVHIYGRSCDMPALRRLSDKFGLRVIEDCAEYHGGTLSGLADASCWSFYRNKIVHGEEGGMISFRDSRCASLARLLRCQGFTDDHDFYHVPRGINARLSNANAQLILNSLSDVDYNLMRRRKVELWYDRLIQSEWRMPRRDVVWVYDIAVPDAEGVVQVLNRFGAEARMAFKPMSTQEEYRGDFSELNAWRLCKQVMYLPVRPEMDEGEVERNVKLLWTAMSE